MKTPNALRHNPSIVLLAVTALAGCGGADPTSPPPPATDSTEAFLEARGFQGSVLLRRNGETILERGFGDADRTTGEPNRVQTRHRIGSVTKSFTAVALAELKRQGQITSFDQPVADFFPDYPRGDEITLRHLLTHHSGLPDYLDSIDESAPYTPQELVEAIIDDPLHFDPGTYFEYSNTNYAALGVIIESLTGMDYATYLRTAVLEPLGMHDTSYGVDPIAAPGEARGYEGTKAAERIDMSVPYAAGALISTVSDLGIWAEMMLGGDYLSDSDRAELLPAPHPEAGITIMGMGWFALNAGEQTVYHHGGDIAGFTSLVALFPDDNGYLVLLSNVQDQAQLRSDLLERLIAGGLR